MHEKMLAAASRLTDDALHARLEQLATRERDATVELVAHLAVLLGRRKHLRQGWGSVYAWCCDVLRLSQDAAYNRVAAARAVRRFPVILDHLAAGFLNVTTVKLLRPVLTPTNHLAVLAEAKHRSKRECELIVARLQPKPDVPSIIQKVAPTSSVCSWPASLTAAPTVSPEIEDQAHRAVPLVPPAPPPVVAPLSPERYRVQFTVSQETHDKLRRVQELLCREVPSGDPARIFDRALDALLREALKQKRAATPTPRAPREAAEHSRTIPAHVARAVWARDGNRCAFVGTKGRCQERRFLELHHVQPYGYRGPATAANISVRCRGHNVFESELVFGPYSPSITREAFRQNAGFAPSERRSGTAGIGASHGSARTREVETAREN